MSLRNEHPPHRLYLISRFASESNRRLMRVLSLQTEGFSPIVVQEDHTRKLQGLPNITIPRGFRPGHALKFLGLRTMGNALDRRLYFPSPAVQFARRAARALAPRIARDLENGRCVSVVTFVPPHDVLETGRRLKQQFPAVRWIVVCQIVWALDEHHQHGGAVRFIARMRDFEGAHLRAADRIAVESAGVKQELHRLYQIPEEHIHAIENAYDETDVALGAQSDQHDAASSGGERPFTIGFLGNCFKPPKVPGDRLLAALRSVVNRGWPLHLRIIGDAWLDRHPDHVRPYPWITCYPRCGHSEALRLLTGSDALLLFVARTPWTRVLMHAKLPYYLASGIPIIAIVPSDSNTADIIRRTGAGIVIDSDSDWGAELEKCLSEWDRDSLAQSRNPEEIARFSWSAVAQKWTRCLGHPAPPPARELPARGHVYA